MSHRNLKFTLNGEWVEAEGAVRKVGIGAQNARELGEVTFIGEAPIGRTVRAGEVLLSLEASKAAFDVFSPLDGRVRAVNPRVLEDPSLIGRDPYGEGWLVELEVDDPDESHLRDAPVTPGTDGR